MAIKRVKSATKTIDKGDMTEAQYGAFITRLAAGLQTKDIIVLVNYYKKLDMSDADIIEATINHNSDVGKFLEEKKIIPAGTGIIFNMLQHEWTIVDALSRYASLNQIDAENCKLMLTKLSESGLYGVLKAIENKEITVPGPTPEEPEASSVTVSLDTSTELTQNEYTQINAITFSGTVVESDPVTVKITPTNCTFKGVVSDAETEVNAEKEFEPFTSLENLNNEFKTLQVKPTATSDVKLSVVIDEGEPNEFTFSTVNPSE